MFTYACTDVLLAISNLQLGRSVPDPLELVQYVV